MVCEGAEIRGLFILSQFKWHIFIVVLWTKKKKNHFKAQSWEMKPVNQTVGKECCFYPRFQGIFLQDKCYKCNVEENNFSMLWTCPWDVVLPAPTRQQPLCSSHSCCCCTAGTWMKGIHRWAGTLCLAWGKDGGKLLLPGSIFEGSLPYFVPSLRSFTALPVIMCWPGSTWHWWTCFCPSMANAFGFAHRYPWEQTLY